MNTKGISTAIWSNAPSSPEPCSTGRGQRKGVRYFRILSSVNSIIYFLLKVREKLSLFYYTIYGFLHGIPFPIHDFHPHRSPGSCFRQNRRFPVIPPGQVREGKCLVYHEFHRFGPFAGENTQVIQDNITVRCILRFLTAYLDSDGMLLIRQVRYGKIGIWYFLS